MSVQGQEFFGMNNGFSAIKGEPIFLNWAQFKSLCEELADKIDWNKYNSIYPIIRGGVYPAIELSRISGLPIVWELCDGALIVDEISDSGATLRTFHELGRDSAVLHFKGRGEAPTYYARETKDWIVYPWETPKDVESVVNRQIEYVGDDPTRPELVKTPTRVVQSWKEIYSGYTDDVAAILSARPQMVRADELRTPIILKNVEFFSMNERYLLPFFGTITLGYLPTRKFVDAVALAQLVSCFSRRLQTQERMCDEIAAAIADYLEPAGVYVEATAQRLDSVALGGGRIDSVMTTLAVRGDFEIIEMLCHR